MHDFSSYKRNNLVYPNWTIKYTPGSSEYPSCLMMGPRGQAFPSVKRETNITIVNIPQPIKIELNKKLDPRQFPWDPTFHSNLIWRGMILFLNITHIPDYTHFAGGSYWPQSIHWYRIFVCQNSLKFDVPVNFYFMRNNFSSKLALKLHLLLIFL